jgi:hypothetical protein
MRHANKTDFPKLIYSKKAHHLSSNHPDDQAATENPPGSAPQTSAPPVFAVPPPPPSQQVACPRCYTLVPIGTRYCPQCGNPIPPSLAWPGVFAPPPAPRGRNTAAIVVAVVLIAVLVVGVSGYLIYNQEQQQVLQAAKNNESNAASQAINELQFTCFSNSTDNSHLQYTQGIGYSGYLIQYDTWGIMNPTTFSMDVGWTLTYDVPSAYLIYSNSQSFYEAAHGGTAYPRFAFTITATQLNNIPSTADFNEFTVSVEGSYVVMGTYGTYNLTSNNTYNSTTTGGGTGSGSNLPAC